MPTTHLNPAIPTFFLSIILLCFPATIRTDQPCPYPCYPPPTGGSSGTTPTNPTTSSGTTTTAPPQPTGSTLYPPPSGYYPYYNPPPFYGGGADGGSYGTPPPPDPILPYFPFYYRKPLHGTQESSTAAGAATLQKWTGILMIATTSIFSLPFSFCLI